MVLRPIKPSLGNTERRFSFEGLYNCNHQKVIAIVMAKFCSFPTSSSRSPTPIGMSCQGELPFFCSSSIVAEVKEEQNQKNSKTERHEQQIVSAVFVALLLPHSIWEGCRKSLAHPPPLPSH